MKQEVNEVYRRRKGPKTHPELGLGSREGHGADDGAVRGELEGAEARAVEICGG